MKGNAAAIVLIVLGVFFLLTNLGLISISLRELLRVWWPVALIAVGVVVLLLTRRVSVEGRAELDLSPARVAPAPEPHVEIAPDDEWSAWADQWGTTDQAIVDLGGEATQGGVIVALAMQGQGHDRHVVDGVRLDQRLRD